MSQKYKQDNKKEVHLAVSSSRECTHPNRTRRQEKVQELSEARAKRTDKQQLSHLDNLLGKNKGATKERSRLKASLSKPKEGKTNE